MCVCVCVCVCVVVCVCVCVCASWDRGSKQPAQQPRPPLHCVREMTELTELTAIEREVREGSGETSVWTEEE